MNITRTIKLAYIAYTVFALMVVGTTSIKFTQAILSLSVMWINYCMFSIGYGGGVSPRAVTAEKLRNGWLENRGKSSLLVIGGLTVVFSVVAVKYYTGQLPGTVFTGFSAGNISFYQEYQEFFKEQQRHILTVEKIPFILMLFFVKFTFFYSYLTFLFSTNKTTFFIKFYLLIITSSFIYIGLARGTNFEFFELSLITIFVLTSKANKGATKILPTRTMMSCLVVAVMIYVFYIVIGLRGWEFNHWISNDVYYDETGVVPVVSLFLSNVVLALYGYFGFGFYYVSEYILEIWFSSIGNFFAGLIPYGYVVLGGKPLNVEMREVVDMGVRWHADVVLFINDIGYLGVLASCYFIGLFIKKLNVRTGNSPLSILASFMVFMQMVSLPVGNFIRASSANQLIVILVVMYFFYEMNGRKIRIRLRN